MAYELFCKSVQGSSHIRKGTPCEDFGMTMDSGKYKIFAVADGHGDPNCIRSHIGSEKICRIASGELRNFALTVEEQGREEELFDKDKTAAYMGGLIRSIVGKWGEEVRREYEENPLKGEEMKKASAYGKEYEKGDRIERIYGTTLIAGLQTERYLLLLQQGDGRCDVFDYNGDVSQPIPWDDRCVGTATTSLCDNDAAERCRYHIIDLKENPVIACIAGTDGVEDSFPASMEKTHVYYRELLDKACKNGVQSLEEYLAQALEELSATGSADDITVSGIIDVERVRPFLNKFKEENYRVGLEYKVAWLDSKVKSIEEGGRYQYLKGKYEAACKAYQDACTEYEETKKRYVALKDKCDTLEKQIAEYEKQKNAAKEEYQPCKDRYDSFVQQRNEAQKELDELNGLDRLKRDAKNGG